jgi:hypothetical protein
MGPRWGLTPRLTDWLTVSRNVTLTLKIDLPQSTYLQHATSNLQASTLQAEVHLYVLYNDNKYFYRNLISGCPSNNDIPTLVTWRDLNTQQEPTKWEHTQWTFCHSVPRFSSINLLWYLFFKTWSKGLSHVQRTYNTHVKIDIESTDRMKIIWLRSVKMVSIKILTY